MGKCAEPAIWVVREDDSLVFKNHDRAEMPPKAKGSKLRYLLLIDLTAQAPVVAIAYPVGVGELRF